MIGIALAAALALGGGQGRRDEVQRVATVDSMQIDRWTTTGFTGCSLMGQFVSGDLFILRRRTGVEDQAELFVGNDAWSTMTQATYSVQVDVGKRSMQMVANRQVIYGHPGLLMPLPFQLVASGLTENNIGVTYQGKLLLGIAAGHYLDALWTLGRCVHGSGNPFAGG